MSKKDERTDIEKNLKNEPNQANIDRQCADLLRATANPPKEEQKK